MSISTELAEALDQEKGQGVVVFVGSGPSIQAGLPNWRQLLERIARDYRKEKEVKIALDKGKYLDVAQYLSYLKGEQALQEKIVQIIDESSQIPSDLHEMIVSIPFSGIITTNYDLLLSRADKDKYFEFPITYNRKGLRTHLKKRFIFHLHGNIQDHQSIVLSKSGYDCIMLPKSKHVEHFLKSVFHQRVVLFIGYGFGDLDLDLLLLDMMEYDIIDKWSVYALIPSLNGDIDEVQNAVLRHRNINAIPVLDEGDYGYNSILLWLDNLKQAMSDIRYSRSKSLGKTYPPAQLDEITLVLSQSKHKRNLSRAIQETFTRPDLIKLSGSITNGDTLRQLYNLVQTEEIRSFLIRLNQLDRDPALEELLTMFLPDSSDS